VPEALKDSVESANRVVRSISSRDPEYSNMVTTLDIVVLASDVKRLYMYFAHIGSSSIWLLHAGDSTVQMLSEKHTVDNGSLLRAVGLSQEVLAQMGKVPVQPGDRVFLISAGSGFSFTPEAMDAVLAYAAEPLHDCAAALADAARSSGVPESITIIAAEVSKEAMFSG
jgi:serine/threonine protein phosphatase PrpC